ncbi:hypothetical protein PCL_07097 [Purpureocillium lilacinum]|uniref:Uncharacterized protein n=1 Tax=Purpureocillium lilacinum TaxID=33203 RepID=A0A2U3DSV3_PURLI|nr:hypothetical protein Purlil1_11455 [Purpureocillium lilacinum]PWI65328.1 hypothetical protein PCL_07097 [Purpureocillium lilacinum]
MVLLGPPVPTIYGMPIIAMPATAAMAALAAVARRLDLRPPNGGGRRTGPGASLSSGPPHYWSLQASNWPPAPPSSQLLPIWRVALQLTAFPSRRRFYLSFSSHSRRLGQLPRRVFCPSLARSSDRSHPSKLQPKEPAQTVTLVSQSQHAPRHPPALAHHRPQTALLAASVTHTPDFEIDFVGLSDAPVRFSGMTEHHAND